MVICEYTFTLLNKPISTISNILIHVACEVKVAD